jgi:hypothetical protein
VGPSGECGVVADLVDLATQAARPISPAPAAPFDFHGDTARLGDGRILLVFFRRALKIPGSLAALFRPDNVSPRLAVEPETLDLGQIVASERHAGAFVVRNTGERRLVGTVEAAIASLSGPGKIGGGPPFTLVPETAFDLAPGASFEVPVEVLMGDVGTLFGSVTVRSNGGNTFVQVMGEIGVRLCGRVTVDRAPAPGVTLQLSGGPGAVATTDAEGRYCFFAREPQDYTVTPTSGPGVTPPSHAVAPAVLDVHGLDFWSGTPPDPVEGFARGLYENVLGRDDASGVSFYTAFLGANCNPVGAATAAHNFFDSPEFRTQRPLTLEGLVSVLYQTLLERQPDPSGLDGWAEVFRRERLVVAGGFLGLPEFRAVLPDRHDPAAVGALVTRLYRFALERDPDAPGLAAWVNYIVATGDVENSVAAFLTDRGFEVQPLTFLDYAARLYRMLYAREGSPGEIGAWESLLREHLALVLDAGFLSSPEFRGVLARVCAGH